MKTDDLRIAQIRRMNQRHGTNVSDSLREDIRNDDAARHFRGNSIELPPLMSRDFADWLSRELEYDPPIGFEDREVYVTPFPGHYGLAGYIITVNGSPVRGLVMVLVANKRVCITMDGKKWKHGEDDTSSGTQKQRYERVLDFLTRLGLPTEPYGQVPDSSSPCLDDGMNAL